MTAEIVLQPTRNESFLAQLRRQLAQLRLELKQREAALSQLRSQLSAFESRYFRQVGVLYAELDEIEAKIREREADLYDSDEARTRAAEARERAQQSHDAAQADTDKARDFDPPQSLRALFREVARRIHPDRAQDSDEAEYLNLLMARANAAYRRGDEDMLRSLLADGEDVEAVSSLNDTDAELQKISRQMQHARRDLATLAAERESLLAGDIAALYADAERATTVHRDLLAELATSVRQQIEEARYRYEFVQRQVTAHGR